MCINEHHRSAYGNMPSPNLIAACLACAATKNIQIAIVGNALLLYDHPIRVAEEIAMPDVITGGRIISGQVIDHGPEYYSYGVNPRPMHVNVSARRTNSSSKCGRKKACFRGKGNTTTYVTS